MWIEEQKDLKQSQEAVFSSADVAEMQRFIENLDDKESRDQFLKAADEAIANIPEEAKNKLADSLKLVCEKNKDDPDFKNLMLKYWKLANVLWINFENSPSNVDASNVNTLKELMSDVNVLNKEYWLMLICMSGKSNEFISSCWENKSDTKNVFENTVKACIDELKNKWLNDVRDIVLWYDFGNNNSNFELNIWSFSKIP